MTSIKKKVKEKIKIYSKEEYLDGYIENEFLTDDGKADIFLNINHLDELYDFKTAYSQVDLNKSVYDLIDTKSSMLNNDIPLKLVIMGMHFDSKEQEEIEHIISEHYAIELYKIQKKYKRYNTKVVNLLLLGIAFLLAYAIVAITTETVFIKEVIGFLFSFALWEAFDALIYTQSDIKLQRESITQKLIMDIEFKEEKENRNNTK